jgi:hypothetical protein
VCGDIVRPPLLLQVDLEGLSREELMAFTLNTYNALVIHALVVQGTAQMGSLLGRARFFTQVSVCRVCGACMTSGRGTEGPAASSVKGGGVMSEWQSLLDPAAACLCYAGREVQHWRPGLHL